MAARLGARHDGPLETVGLLVRQAFRKGNDMQYTNVKLPASVMFMDTDDDVQAMLVAFVGHECELTDTAAIGSSAYGPWEEGDIWYEDGGSDYALHYDFYYDFDREAGRVFRYEIEKLN